MKLYEFLETLGEGKQTAKKPTEKPTELMIRGGTSYFKPKRIGDKPVHPAYKGITKFANSEEPKYKDMPLDSIAISVAAGTDSGTHTGNRFSSIRSILGNAIQANRPTSLLRGELRSDGGHFEDDLSRKFEALADRSDSQLNTLEVEPGLLDWNKLVIAIEAIVIEASRIQTSIHKGDAYSGPIPLDAIFNLGRKPTFANYFAHEIVKAMHEEFTLKRRKHERRKKWLDRAINPNDNAPEETPDPRADVGESEGDIGTSDISAQYAFGVAGITPLSQDSIASLWKLMDTEEKDTAGRLKRDPNDRHGIAYHKYLLGLDRNREDMAIREFGW